eukprot:jgi/Tetstr1/432352/TSEL_021749.t1
MPCAGDQQRQRLRRLQGLQQQLAHAQRNPQQQQRPGGAGGSKPAAGQSQPGREDRSSLSPAAREACAAEGSAVMREAAATASRYRAFLAATTSSGSPLPEAPLASSSTVRTTEMHPSLGIPDRVSSQALTADAAVAPSNAVAADLLRPEDVREATAVPRPHNPPAPVEATPAAMPPCPARGSGCPTAPAETAALGVPSLPAGGPDVRQAQRQSQAEGQRPVTHVAHPHGAVVSGDPEGVNTADSCQPMRAEAASRLSTPTAAREAVLDVSGSSDSDSDDSLFAELSRDGDAEKRWRSAGRRPAAHPVTDSSIGGYMELAPAGEASGSRLRLCSDVSASELLTLLDGRAIIPADSEELCDDAETALPETAGRDNSTGDALLQSPQPRRVALHAECAVEGSPPSPEVSLDESAIVAAFCQATAPSAAVVGASVAHATGRAVLAAWHSAAVSSSLLRAGLEAAASSAARPLEAWCPWQRGLAGGALKRWARAAQALARRSRMLQAALAEEHRRWVALGVLRAWADAVLAAAELLAAVAAESRIRRGMAIWRNELVASRASDAAALAAAAGLARRRVWRVWRAECDATAVRALMARHHYKRAVASAAFQCWATRFMALAAARTQLRRRLASLRASSRHRALAATLGGWRSIAVEVGGARSCGVAALAAAWARMELRAWAFAVAESRADRLAMQMRRAWLLGAAFRRWTALWAREAACRAMLRHSATALVARTLARWQVEAGRGREEGTRALAAARQHRLSKLWAAFRAGCRLVLQRAVRRHLADSYRDRLALAKGLAALSLYARWRARRAALGSELRVRLSRAALRTALDGWTRQVNWATSKRAARQIRAAVLLRRALLGWSAALRLSRLRAVAEHRADETRALRALGVWKQQARLSSRLQEALLLRLVATGVAALRAWLAAARDSRREHTALMKATFCGWAAQAAREADLSHRLVVALTLAYERKLQAVFDALRKARGLRVEEERARAEAAVVMSSQRRSAQALRLWKANAAERRDAGRGVLADMLTAAFAAADRAGGWFRNSSEGAFCRDALDAWWSVARRLGDARRSATVRRDERLWKAASAAFYAWCSHMLDAAKTLYLQHQLKQTMQDELVVVVGTERLAAAAARRSAQRRCIQAWRAAVAQPVNEAQLHFCLRFGRETLRGWQAEHTRAKLTLRLQST